MKSIHILGETLPECWEKAVVACWEQGSSFPTEYDKQGDPNSRDVIAMIHVKNPFAEPRIHRCFPGGLDDLEKYRSEVLYGVHDHWIDPAAGKWEYTYHERLRDYKVLCDQCSGYGSFDDGNSPCTVCNGTGTRKIDQIAGCVEMLKKVPFTRRAQAVTWQVWNDLGIDDPTCLQRFWFRVEDGRLHMNCHIRSNDGFKAGFMNMFAFTELQAEMAKEIGVEPGEYCHIADSFHIYGSYFDEFDGFMKTIAARPEDQRVFDTSLAIPFFIEACDTLLKEGDMMEDKKELVRKRREYLVSLE
jgi:thymidylate synthase